MRLPETSGLNRNLYHLLFSVTLCLFAAVGASAHELGQSYIFLSIYDEELLVRIEIREDDLTRALGVTVDGSAGRLDPLIAESIRTYVEERLEIKAENQTSPLRFTHFSSRNIKIADPAPSDSVHDSQAGLLSPLRSQTGGDSPGADFPLLVC